MKKRQAYLPAAAVAVVAVVLQLAAFVTRPGEEHASSRLDALRIGYGTTLGFVIRALDPTFVGRQLGQAFDGLLSHPAKHESAERQRGATTSSEPSPSHRAASRTPRPTADQSLIKGAGNIELSMTVNRTSVLPDGLLIYEVVATNTGDRAVTTVYTINTHAPRFTLLCADAAGSPCTTPGTYDGSSSDPNDPHVVPAATERTTMVGPHQKVVIRRLRVQVTAAAPSGTKLFNHAHVDVVGDNKSAKTIRAPTVVVK